MAHIPIGRNEVPEVSILKPGSTNLPEMRSRL